MKITLAEWRAFDAAWSAHAAGKNWYFEDQILGDEDEYGNRLDGVDPETKFELTGFLCWQGAGDMRAADFLGDWSLETAVKKWRKMRAFETHVINVPKEKVDEVRAALLPFGIKI